MQQIGVAGLSYRHAGTGHIAGFAIPKDEVIARLPALQAALGVDELLYLSTCNRVELLFSMADGIEAPDCRDRIFTALTGREPAAGEARSALRAWSGEAAVEHVFLVACGLDSAQAGEREIAAQLRTAWEDARSAGVCRATLDHVVGEALAMSNRVQQLAAGARPPSLADLAMDRMHAHLRGRAHAIALIGISPMTRRCAERFYRSGLPLVVVNRSPAAADELVQELAARMREEPSSNGVANGVARAMSLDDFRAQPPDVAGVMVATGSTDAVLGAAALARLARAATHSPLLVDFALPPNIDPSAANDAGLQRIGMDELIESAQEQRIAQLMRLAPVRAAIDERLTRLRGQLAARGIGKQLAELREAFERIAGVEMNRLLAQDLQGLEASQKEQLQRFATTMARRLAHIPLAGMRAAAEHASAETVEAFFREARLQRGAEKEPDIGGRFEP